MAALVQSGQVYYGLNYFGVSTPNWPLIGAIGTRAFSATVAFPVAYTVAPTVMVSLSSVMVINQAGVKADVKASNITTTGFTLTVETWDDCQIMGIGVSWIALTLS